MKRIDYCIFKSLYQQWEDLISHQHDSKRIHALLILRDVLPELLGWKFFENTDNVNDSGYQLLYNQHQIANIFQIKLIYLTLDFLYHYPKSLNDLTRIEQGLLCPKEHANYDEQHLNALNANYDEYSIEFVHQGFPLSMILDLHFGPDEDSSVDGNESDVQAYDPLIEESSADIEVDHYRTMINSISKSYDSDFNCITDESDDEANRIMIESIFINHIKKNRMKLTKTESYKIMSQSYKIQREKRDLPTLLNCLQPSSLHFRVQCLTLLTTWAIEFNFYVHFPLEFFHILELLQRTVSGGSEISSVIPTSLNEYRLLPFFSAQCLTEFELSYPGLLSKWICHCPNIPLSLQSDSNQPQSIGQSVIYQSLHRLAQCCQCISHESHESHDYMISHACTCGVYTFILECYALYDPSIRPYIPTTQSTTHSTSKTTSRSLAVGSTQIPILLNTLTTTSGPYHNALLGLIVTIFRSFLEAFTRDKHTLSNRPDDNTWIEEYVKCKRKIP